MLCSRVQNQLSAYCDSELTGADMLEVRRHLGECPDCQAEYQQLRQMKLLMGALTDQGPSRPFRLEEVERRSRVAPPQPRWARVASEWARFIVSGAPRLQPGTPFLALSTSLALSTMVLGMLGTPQRPDAVAAHVPAAVSEEDRGTPVHEPQVTAVWTAPVALPGEDGPYQSGDQTELVSYRVHRTVRLPYYAAPALNSSLVLPVSYAGGLSEMSQSANNFSR